MNHRMELNGMNGMEWNEWNGINRMEWNRIEEWMESNQWNRIE